MMHCMLRAVLSTPGTIVDRGSCAVCAPPPQAAAEKLHQQLSLVGQPHSFLIRQLAAAESTAAAAQSELAATKVSTRTGTHHGHRGIQLEDSTLAQSVALHGWVCSHGQVQRYDH